MRVESLVTLGAIVLSLGLTSPAVLAATADKAKAKTSKSTKASSPSKVRKSKTSPSATKKSAAAQPAPEPLTEAQLNAAKLVHTGRADCEFNQSVVVEPDMERSGAFQVSFDRKTYRMTSEETPTGAVRLQDPSAGVVWLQLGLKSMLMNVKAGQRMVDACTNANQRMVQAQVDAYEADQARVASAAANAAASASAVAMPVAATSPNPDAPVTTVNALPGAAATVNAAPRAQKSSLLRN